MADFYDFGSYGTGGKPVSTVTQAIASTPPSNGGGGGFLDYINGAAAIVTAGTDAYGRVTAIDRGYVPNGAERTYDRIYGTDVAALPPAKSGGISGNVLLLGGALLLGLVVFLAAKR